MALTFAQLENTSLGPLSFVAGDRGLQGVGFMNLYQYKQALGLTSTEPSLRGLEILSTLLVEIHAYLHGFQKEFSVDIDWEIMDDFQKQVLKLTAEIPYGQVSTYGAMAVRLGKPGAARAVGTALSRNPMPIVIPCHRVIGSKNAITGYKGGLKNKAFLLVLEGHTINNQKVVL